MESVKLGGPPCVHNICTNFKNLITQVRKRRGAAKNAVIRTLRVINPPLRDGAYLHHFTVIILENVHVQRIVQIPNDARTNGYFLEMKFGKLKVSSYEQSHGRCLKIAYFHHETTGIESLIRFSEKLRTNPGSRLFYLRRISCKFVPKTSKSRCRIKKSFTRFRITRGNNSKVSRQRAN